MIWASNTGLAYATRTIADVVQIKFIPGGMIDRAAEKIADGYLFSAICYKS